MSFTSDADFLLQELAENTDRNDIFDLLKDLRDTAAEARDDTIDLSNRFSAIRRELANVKNNMPEVKKRVTADAEIAADRAGSKTWQGIALAGGAGLVTGVAVVVPFVMPLAIGMAAYADHKFDRANGE